MQLMYTNDELTAQWMNVTVLIDTIPAWLVGDAMNVEIGSVVELIDKQCCIRRQAIF